MSNVVKIPKPSRTAYNPHRLLEKNQLIQSQVKHFQEAELGLPPEFRTGVDIATVTTEGKASEYIRLVTRAIHASGGRQSRKTEEAT